MDFLNNSRDLLNIAIAASVVGFTFFLCWSIFYFVMIMRQAFLGVKEMRGRLQKIDELLKTVKEKIDNSASYLLLIGEGLKKLVEVIRERSGKKTGKKT